MLVDSSTPPLWIQGLKRLALWIQTLTLLEDQGLWIQATVLHCSCTKASLVSKTPRYKIMFEKNEVTRNGPSIC